MLPRNIFIGRKYPKVFPVKVVLKIYNFTEITHRCGCSLVDLMHIFRSPFYGNTTGRLFLFILLYVGEGCSRRFAVRKRECRNQTVQYVIVKRAQ